MAARRELLERIENESKAYGSDFGSHYLPTWQEFETAVRSLCSQYVLISFALCHYRDIRQIQFQECGVRHTWGASKSMTKDDAMIQVYTCSWTKAGHSLKYSSFIMLLEAPQVWRTNWYNVLETEFVSASWAYLRSSYVNTALPLRTVALMIMSKVLFRCFQYCLTMHSCYESTSAWPFPPHYSVLVRAQTRCACFKPT